MFKRIVLCLVLVSLFTATSDAWPWRRRSRTRVSYSIGGSPQQIVQQKAQIQANRGRCFHPGGSFGGCRYEGVGSSTTPRGALANCCYSGARGSKGPKKICVASAVAKSSNGRYYACRLYR